MEEIIALLKSPGWWFSTLVAGVVVGLLTNYLGSGRIIAHLQSGKSRIEQLSFLRWIQIAVGAHTLLLSVIAYQLLTSRAEATFGFFAAALLVVLIPLLQLYWIKNPAGGLFLIPITLFFTFFLSVGNGRFGLDELAGVYLFSALFAFVLVFITWKTKDMKSPDEGKS